MLNMHFHLIQPHALFEEGNGTPLQYSCLENPMDGGAWWAAVHGVAKSRTWLSDFTFTFHFHALEKEMATHSSVLAWRIPGTGELVGGCLWGRRVGHDWSDLAAACSVYFKIHVEFINGKIKSTLLLNCLASLFALPFSLLRLYIFTINW